MTKSLSAAVMTLLLQPSAGVAGDARAQCASRKLMTASRYTACQLKADSRAATSGGPANYAKCDSAFYSKYLAAESQAGPGVCPSELDVDDVQNFLSACSASVVATLTNGIPLPQDPMACASELVVCQSSLVTKNDDLGACNSILTTCSGSLASTNADLGACQG